jgi:deoxycytidylate deaminase
MKKRFFDIAQKLAQKSDHASHQLGAVLVSRGKIVSFGWNQMKTSPHSPHPFKSIHAEFHALSGVALKDLKDTEMYVFREKKDGSLGNAKPCKFCAKMLELSGIKKVYYTIDGGYDETK